MVLGQIGTYLHSQIGTCRGQFGTSIKNNLVIIKYLYKNKKRKLDLLASTKYTLYTQSTKFFLVITIKFDCV